MSNSYPDYLDLRAENDVFTDVAAHSPMLAVMRVDEEVEPWPAGTAVGRRFRLGEWDGGEYEVVGVAADYKVRFPTEEPASYVHGAASQHLRTGGAACPNRGRRRRPVCRHPPRAPSDGAGSLVLSLGLVLATGAWVVATGTGVGAVLAVLATRLATRLMPGITLADPVVCASVLLLIAGVTAAAHVGPVRRIMRLDLTQALCVE